MLRILHISDLHFGPPYLPHVGDAVLKFASCRDLQAIVASGDFTQRAKAHQFAEARQFLDRLPDVPKVVVPGNHDVPLYRVGERLLDPHREYRRYISPELDRVWHFDEATIVGVDSTSPRRAITNGRIRDDQLDFCARAFRESSNGAARIVVSHHHFAPAPDYERDQTVPKSKRCMRHFVRMGVDMIMGGHLHRSYIGDSLDFYPKLRSGHQGIIIVQCGTTTSRRGRGRERERNTLNTIDVSPGRIEVTHYMYFDDTGTFEAISHHRFPRKGNRSAEWSTAPNEAVGRQAEREGAE